MLKVLAFIPLPSPFVMQQLQISLDENNCKLDVISWSDNPHRDHWDMNKSDLLYSELGYIRKFVKVLSILDGYDRVIVSGYREIFLIQVVNLFRKMELRKFVVGPLEMVRTDLSVKGYIRSIIIKFALRKIKLVLAVGKVAHSFYQSHTESPVIDYIYSYDYGLSSAKRKISQSTNVMNDEKSKRKRILYSGALNSRRNLNELLQALVILRTQNIENFVLIISAPLSDMEAVANAEDLILRYDLGAHCCWDSPKRGWNKIIEIYSDVDILVVPNIYSTWNLTIQEALLHGVPVISTIQTVAAIHFIIPAINGELYSSGDVTGLVEKLKRFLEDECYFSKIRHNCRSLSSQIIPYESNRMEFDRYFYS